ncbi:MAG TPA: hypothetical protein VL475_11395, partial [Planctomycetaceae bacterium]|nr:hypothetical protein [Planctomycetaceae bacterium]
MTLIDRALTKAYSQRSAATPQAEELPRSAPLKRGWVAKLRPPARETGPLRQPLQNGGIAVQSRLPAAPPKTNVEPISVPDQTLAPAARQFVRVDAKHSQRIEEFAVAPPPAVGWAWPPICEQLLSSAAGPGIRGLASLLREMLVERGQRSLALTGPRRGAGRTSLAL